MFKKHRPSILTTEGSGVYFLSARTYGGFCHLNSKEKKDTFKEILFEKAEKFQGEVNHWVVISNHYHLLIGLENSLVLPKFIQELHGASAFKIKKLPVISVLNEEQIMFRGLTPLEMRVKSRIFDLWRELKLAKTIGECRLKPAKTGDGRELKLAKTPLVLADFSPRLVSLSEDIIKTIEKDDYRLFEMLVSSILPDIPFWHYCYNHAIRNEVDYFRHFNYITQNPIKHGIVKNLWEYEFSGIFNYDRDYIIDCLRDYPIIDFGGEYD